MKRDKATEKSPASPIESGLFVPNATLRAVMVMCEGSIPSCVYEEIATFTRRVAAHLGVKPGETIRWLAEAEKIEKGKR